MRRWMAVASLVLGSCASTPAREPVRIAVVEVVSRVDPPGPDYASWVRDYLHDALFATGRFRLLERRHVDAVLEQTGKDPNKAGLVVGAEWIVYGAVTEAVLRGGTSPDQPQGRIGEVELQLRVVRVQTSEIVYSKHLRGISQGSGDIHSETLLRQAIRRVADQAAAEVAKLKP